MKNKNIRFGGQPPVEVPTADPLVAEMQGHDEMGTHEDALKTARAILARPKNSAGSFYAALHVILIHAGSLAPWKPCVAAAYQRLSKTAKAAVRFWMLTFHIKLANHRPPAARLPKRFTGAYGLLELCYAMDAVLGLDHLPEFHVKNAHYISFLAAKV